MGPALPRQHETQSPLMRDTHTEGDNERNGKQVPPATSSSCSCPSKPLARGTGGASSLPSHPPCLREGWMPLWALTRSSHNPEFSPTRSSSLSGCWTHTDFWGWGEICSVQVGVSPPHHLFLKLSYIIFILEFYFILVAQGTNPFSALTWKFCYVETEAEENGKVLTPTQTKGDTWVPGHEEESHNPGYINPITPR